jgi:hypothetical protein
MDLTGARWSLGKAEAILRLRSLARKRRLRRILALPRTAASICRGLRVDVLGASVIHAEIFPDAGAA